MTTLPAYTAPRGPAAQRARDRRIALLVVALAVLCVHGALFTFGVWFFAARQPVIVAPTPEPKRIEPAPQPPVARWQQDSFKRIDTK